METKKKQIIVIKKIKKNIYENGVFMHIIHIFIETCRVFYYVKKVFMLSGRSTNIQIPWIYYRWYLKSFLSQGSVIWRMLFLWKPSAQNQEILHVTLSFNQCESFLGFLVSRWRIGLFSA